MRAFTAGSLTGKATSQRSKKIARHPVGRAKVDIVVAAIRKVEDAGVLEEAAHDGAYADVAGEAFDTGAQDAEAADDEIDFDAGI